MARPRRSQPRRLQDALSLRPVASPVDLFAQPYVSGQPNGPHPLQAFASLSATLAPYFEEEAKKRKEREELEGERFVQEHPELVAHLEEGIASEKDEKARRARTIQDIEFLQKNGVILPMANPNKRVGYMRASGRLMASLYQQRVLERINEVSTVRDEAGAPTIPVLPETILGQEWEKIAGSPAVQSFYGGQEALRVKQQVDEGFRIEAAKRRANALDIAHVDLVSQEFGRMFEQALLEPVVTTETLKPITAYLANEVRGYSILNPRELAFEALQLTFSKLAATDPKAALRAVHAAEELQIGGVRLGDDRGQVGVDLQKLKRQYQEDERVAGRKELQEESTRRELAIQEAQADYMPLIVKAKREGIPLTVVARQLGDQYLRQDAENDRFGGYGAFVVDELERFVLNTDTVRQSDQAVMDRVSSMVAQGQIDDAERYLDASHRNGSVTGPDYAAAKGRLQARKAVSPLVEGDQMYQGFKGRYDQLKPTGFALDVQQRVDDRALELQTQATQDFAAFAATTREAPDGEEQRRNWLEERWRADKQEFRKIEQETRGSRDVALKEVRAKMIRHQDAGPDIERLEQQGTFTINEAAELRQENLQAAAGRERLLQVDAIGQSIQNLQAQFSLAFPSPEAADLTILDTAVQDIYDRHAAAVDAILADPSIDPRAFASRSRSEAVRVSREVQDELFPSLRKQAEAALKAGRGAAGESQRRLAYEADQTLAQTLQATVADPARRESMSAKDLAPLQAPGVPQRFYEYAAGWQSGLDPLIGAPVDRDTVVGEAITSLRRVSAEQRPAADLSVISVLGVDPLDVLRGSAELTLPPGQVAEIQREIDFLESPAGAILSGGVGVDRLRNLKAIVEPVRIDLTGLKLRPLTTPFFRTREALNAFSDDPAWPEFLRRLGLTPDDKAQVDEFIDAQLDAIERTNP